MKLLLSVLAITILSVPIHINSSDKEKTSEYCTYDISINETNYRRSIKKSKCPIVLRFKDNPSKCSGSVSKYRNDILFLLGTNDGQVLNVLVVNGDIVLSQEQVKRWVANIYNGSDVLKCIYGEKIDVVSGSLAWSIGRKSGGVEYKFHNAPVICMKDFELRSSGECNCKE